MKTFNIYKHPTEGLEAVKVGFSWPALVFGMLWMMVKKLWGFAGLWFVASVVLALFEGVIERADAGGGQALAYLLLAAGYFTLAFVPALKGNKWREDNLAERGYEQVGTVQAETPGAALAQSTKLA
jgi:hypothetical protein